MEPGCRHIVLFECATVCTLVHQQDAIPHCVSFLFIKAYEYVDRTFQLKSTYSSHHAAEDCFEYPSISRDCGWLEDGEFSQWFCLEQALHQRCILAMRFFRHLDGLDAFRDGSVEAYTPYKESMVLDAEGILSSQESLGTAPVQQVPPNLCLEHSDF